MRGEGREGGCLGGGGGGIVVSTYSHAFLDTYPMSKPSLDSSVPAKPAPGFGRFLWSRHCPFKPIPMTASVSAFTVSLWHTWSGLLIPKPNLAKLPSGCSSGPYLPVVNPSRMPRHCFAAFCDSPWWPVMPKVSSMAACCTGSMGT